LYRFKSTGKVVPVLKHNAMEIYGGSGAGYTLFYPQHYMKMSGQLHAPAALLPGEFPLGTYCIGCWVGRIGIPNAVAKIKFPTPVGN